MKPLLLATALLVSGCTVVPRAPELPDLASFDTAPGGVVELVSGGARLTPRAVARYEGLIALYGNGFVPALQPGHGLVGDVISNDGLEKFMIMNQWRRMGRAPIQISYSGPSTGWAPHVRRWPNR